MAELAESVGPHVVYSILAKRTSSFNDTKNEVEIKNNTEVEHKLEHEGDLFRVSEQEKMKEKLERVRA